MAFERFINEGGRSSQADAPPQANTRIGTPAPGARKPNGGFRGASLIRVLDLVIAAMALVFIAPLMVVIALSCWLQDGGPMIYAQRRQGRNGGTFPCLKFRSMVVDADQRLKALLEADPDARAEWEATHKLVRDPRITRWGSFLRKSSLDELPQLVNVIRGDMSLVGPRPIIASEMPRYGRFIADYQSVLPGVTGLWQVSGRSETNYRRRVALDVLYIRRKSLGLYLYILTMTVPAVLMRKGAV